MLEMCSSIMLPLCYVWHILTFTSDWNYLTFIYNFITSPAVDLPHPLLCWGLQDWCIVMVRMWRCFWQDGAVNCFRFADTLLADTASHHWLLGSFYCQDRVLWWYFVWISNTIWSGATTRSYGPCTTMSPYGAVQSVYSLLWELGAKYLMDTKEVVLFSLLKVDRNPAKNFINTWTKQY